MAKWVWDDERKQQNRAFYGQNEGC